MNCPCCEWPHLKPYVKNMASRFQEGGKNHTLRALFPLWTVVPVSRTVELCKEKDSEELEVAMARLFHRSLRRLRKFKERNNNQELSIYPFRIISLFKITFFLFSQQILSLCQCRVILKCYPLLRVNFLYSKVDFHYFRVNLRRLNFQYLDFMES